jgi:ferric-dicitrate binding protein FerR (iron transport regulator)
MSDSPVSPEDIRAAAETYAELGPEYHDAVVASFLDKIGREVDARVEARLAAAAPAAPLPRKRRRAPLTRRRVLRDVTAAAAGALAVVGAVAVAGVHHPSGERQSGPIQVLPKPAGPGEIIVGPDGTKHIVIPQPKLPQPKTPQAPAAPGG